MDTRVNYTIIGLFVLGLGAMLVFSVLWFSIGQYKDYDDYLVYINESVSGLNKEAVVRFNGVDVGYVSDIKLNPKDPQQVELTLSIATGTPMNEGTTATLMTQGFTGLAYVGLKARTLSDKPLKAPPNYPYPVIPSEPSLLMQVDMAMRELTNDMRQINASFQRLLNEENQQAIHAILANSAKLTQTLSDNSEEIDTSIKEAAEGLAYGKDLTRQLSRETAPSTMQILDKMSRVLTDLEEVASSLKQNPSILIRGKAPVPPGPGE